MPRTPAWRKAQRRLSAPEASRGGRTLQRILEPEDSLLDVVDNLLNRGVVLNGELILALADVDLVYLRLSLLLCAADRVFHQPRGRRSRP